MQYYQDRAWLEISLDVIAENYHMIKKEIGDKSEIMAVIKADAYGLGALPIAHLLEECGCPIFAVASIEEALELREGGIQKPIAILSPLPVWRTESAIQNNIEVPVVSLAQAQKLSIAAQKTGQNIKIHIKADAGLSRFGIVLKNHMEEAIEEAMAIAALPGLQLEGVMTHFTAADIPLGEQFNLSQIALFDTFCQRLKENGLQFKTHCASTVFTALYEQSYHDYVRVAALLLGLAEPLTRGIKTIPSVQLKSVIYQTKDLDTGIAVSYGPNYYTMRPTKIAIIPIGFADGLHRIISNKVSFMLHGKWAPIIGKVTMDYTILDVTDIPEAQEGDIVTIFGEDHELQVPAYEFANHYPMSTVGEVTSVLSPRIPRFYIKNGKMLHLT